MACIGTGSIILRVILKRINVLSAATFFATSFILGEGILASFWLGLALLGVFDKLEITIILIVCFLLPFFFARHQFVAFFKQMKNIGAELKNETLIWKIITCLTILLVLFWGTSLGRTVLGDGSAIYFALPKVIASSHHLVSLPGYEAISYIGLQGEMHFAALMAIGSPDAAQLFSWPTIIAGSIMLLALGRIAGLNRRGQWITLAMVFTSSCVIWLSGDGKTDLFAAAFGLSAYYWAIRTWERSIKEKAGWLTGLFAGFAIIAKLSYIPVLLSGIAIIVCWGYIGKNIKERSWKIPVIDLMKISGCILLGFIIAILPHMIKNAVILSNPIAPFGTTNVNQVWFSPETTRRILITYPFALTFGSFWAQYGTLSPLILAFLPLAFLLPRPKNIFNSPLTAITFSATCGLIIWMITEPSVIAPRYLLSTLLLFFLLPSKAVQSYSQAKSKYNLVNIFIFFSVLITLCATTVYFNNLVFFPKRSISMLTNKITPCERDGEYCSASEAINIDAKPGDRVFFASFYRYWLRPDLIQCLKPSTNSFESNSNSFWLSLYQDGIKYLVFDSNTHIMPYIHEVPSWLTLTPLFQGQTVSSYRLDVATPPVTPITQCIQQQPGLWIVDSVRDDN